MTPILKGVTAYPEEFAAWYREKGYWTGESFGGFLKSVTQRYAANRAISCAGRYWTYAELDRKADELAAGFRHLGLVRNDRVVVQLPNVAEFYVVLFALARIGALPVMALPAHRKLEIRYFCEFTEAKAYVTADKADGFDFRELARKVKDGLPGLEHVVILGEAEEFTALESLYQSPLDLPDMDPASVAFFQLSGGSTGVPKLIPRTHDDYLYSVRASADICGLDEDSVYLCVLPAAHNFPMSSPGALGIFAVGGCVVLADNGSPDLAFRMIAEEGVTVTGVVPPIALVWMEAAAVRRPDLSSLKLLQVGGAKFSAAAAAKVKQTLGCDLQQVFGMAEGLVNYTRIGDPQDIVINTQGRPISPDDEIRIWDDDDKPVAPGEVGHLLTRGPYTIRGYFRADEHNASAFTADGFYRTGDMVRLTPEGYLIVEGRAKDQINRGGEKIAPEEVENVLLSHEGVLDVAVVSMKDKFLGERSCAFVVPKALGLTALQLKAFLREQGLAAFKIPDRIELVNAFPHTGVGKISKRELRRLLTNA